MSETRTELLMVPESHGGWGVASVDVASVIESGTPKSGSTLPRDVCDLMHSVISGSLDVDKLDYLAKDSNALDVQAGDGIDLQRILAGCDGCNGHCEHNVGPNGDSGKLSNLGSVWSDAATAYRAVADGVSSTNAMPGGARSATRLVGHLSAAVVQIVVGATVGSARRRRSRRRPGSDYYISSYRDLTQPILRGPHTGVGGLKWTLDLIATRTSSTRSIEAD